MSDDLYTWEYISDERYEGSPSLSASAPKPSGPRPPIYETSFRIFPVASPGKVYREGEETELVRQGEKIKILDDRWERSDWVYKVDRLSIRLGNGYEVSLKKDTRVAVLPEDYRQQLEIYENDGRERDNSGRGASS